MNFNDSENPFIPISNDLNDISSLNPFNPPTNNMMMMPINIQMPLPTPSVSIAMTNNKMDEEPILKNCPESLTGTEKA